MADAHVSGVKGTQPVGCEYPNCGCPIVGLNPQCGKHTGNYKPADGVAAVEAPSTKPCPECSGGSPGLVDDGSGGFATCEECGGTGRVPLGVDLVDLPQQHESPEKWVSKADMKRAHGVVVDHHQVPKPSDADASKDRP